MTQEIGGEDEKYIRIAEKAQRTSLEPTLKAFLLISIAASSIVLSILGILAYVALTVGGVPTFIYVLLPLLIALEVAIIATLVRALQKASG